MDDNEQNQIIYPSDFENNKNRKPRKIKDPEDWTSGDDPMTAAQRAYLQTLSELHGEHYDENLTKAQAAELIDSKKQNITIPPPYDADGEFWHAIKDPGNWTTGNEPATAAQLSYLKTLATETGEKIDLTGNLTKAEASRQIEALREKTGKGND